MHTNPLLREARSSPYIGASAPAAAARTGGVPPECSATATGASLHAAVSEQHFERVSERVGGWIQIGILAPICFMRNFKQFFPNQWGSS